MGHLGGHEPETRLETGAQIVHHQNTQNRDQLLTVRPAMLTTTAEPKQIMGEMHNHNIIAVLTYPNIHHLVQFDASESKGESSGVQSHFNVKTSKKSLRKLVTSEDSHAVIS